MLKCHCACSSEIGTCIINDAWRQIKLHTKKKQQKNKKKKTNKKQRKYTLFDRISPNDVLYSCFGGI